MLHTVNKSPFERNTLESCLRIAKPGSAILLIEDGVIAAVDNNQHAETILSKQSDFKFYALGPDLDARGLGSKEVINGIDVIDYAGFVDLVAGHDATQSWV